ncbi:hypothetical protein D3C81_1710820 [compost metagenome]
MFAVLPFGTGQHLLQAVEVFEACQQRLFPKPGLAREKTHTVFGMLGRVAGQRAAQQDAPRRGTCHRRIATLAIAPGEDQFRDTVTQ